MPHLQRVAMVTRQHLAEWKEVIAIIAAAAALYSRVTTLETKVDGVNAIQTQFVTSVASLAEQVATLKVTDARFDERLATLREQIIDLKAATAQRQTPSFEHGSRFSPP